MAKDKFPLLTIYSKLSPEDRRDFAETLKYFSKNKRDYDKEQEKEKKKLRKKRICAYCSGGRGHYMCKECKARLFPATHNGKKLKKMV